MSLIKNIARYIYYNNSTSGLAENDVQRAIDEIAERLVNIGGSVDYYSDLASLSVDAGTLYWVRNDTGSRWLLTFKPRAFYIWTGSVWERAEKYIKYAQISSQIENLWQNATTGGASLYPINTIINYGGTLYVNITGVNTDTAPDTDTTNWELLISQDDIWETDGTDATLINDENINLGSGKEYKINGTSINVGGTLDNVAYLDQDNTFTGDIGIGVTPDEVYLDVTGSTSSNSLRLRSGDTGSAPANANQILLSYGGTASYTHSIKSRHYNVGDVSNAIDFYIWDYDTDAVSDVGTAHAMTLQNTASGGAVGINGITNPTTALDVNGSINIASGEEYNIDGVSINTGGTLTNVAYLDQNNVFTGANTFNSIIVNNVAPTLGSHLTNKTYVDNTFEPIDATILKQSDVIDNLISTSTIYPLSANQGKVLKDVQDTLAVDSEVVHLAGTETITGDKTFSGENTFQDDVLLTNSALLYFGTGKNAYIRHDGSDFYCINITGDFIIDSDNTNIKGITELQSNDTTKAFQFYPNLGGLNYLQIGESSTDTSADLVICRMDTTTTNINSLDIYADESTFNGKVSVDSSETGTHNVVDITPQSPLVAGSEFNGIKLNMKALDPATGTGCTIIGYQSAAQLLESVDNNATIYNYMAYPSRTESSYCYTIVGQEMTENKTQCSYYSLNSSTLSTTANYYGVWMNWDTITRDGGSPLLQGVRSEMPADYTDFNFNTCAGYFSGGGDLLKICDGDYAINSTGDVSITGDLTMDGSIYTANNGVDVIGTTTNRFAEVWITGASLHIGEDGNDSSVTYTNITGTPVYLSGQSGLDDLSSSGTYTDTDASIFQVQIDGVGGTNTFQWRKGTGSWTTDVAMTGSPQLLQDGISITWGATTGHKLNDEWIFGVGYRTRIDKETAISSVTSIDNNLFVSGSVEALGTLNVQGNLTHSNGDIIISPNENTDTQSIIYRDEDEVEQLRVQWDADNDLLSYISAGTAGISYTSDIDITGDLTVTAGDLTVVGNGTFGASGNTVLSDGGLVNISTSGSSFLRLLGAGDTYFDMRSGPASAGNINLWFFWRDDWVGSGEGWTVGMDNAPVSNRENFVIKSFYNQTIPEFMITKDGKVAINKETPTVELDVVGDATIDGDLSTTGDISIESASSWKELAFESDRTSTGTLGQTAYRHEGTSTVWVQGKVTDEVNHYGEIEHYVRDTDGMINRLTIGKETTLNSNLTLTAGNLNVANGKYLNVGTSDQLQISSTVSDSTITANTGTFYIETYGGDLEFNSENNDISFTADYGTKNINFYGITNINSSLALTQATDYNQTTGWLYGGQVTVNGGDNTLIDIAAGKIRIVDYATDTTSRIPVFTDITWDAQTALDPGTFGRSIWVGVQDDGAGEAEFVFEVGLTPTIMRDTGILCRLLSNTGDGQISSVLDFERPAWGLTNAMQDWILNFGSFTVSGNKFTPNNSNLLLDRGKNDTNKTWRYHTSDTKGEENTHTESSAIGITAYNYHLQGEDVTTLETAIDPDYWDDGGTKTAMTSDYWSIQEVWYFPTSGTTHVLYGQTEYDSKVAALVGLDVEDKIRNTEILDGAIFRSYVIVQEGTTNLEEAIIIQEPVIGKPSKGQGRVPAFSSRSYAISDYGSIDIFYAAGFYESSDGAITLTIGGTTTETYGTANKAEAAHAFVVFNGGGDASLTLTVSGTSITDAGVRTASDSEVIATGVQLTDVYYETSKKWLGQVTYTVTGTTGSYTFNYGFAKYEDFGNRDFTVTDFEMVGLAGAFNANDLNIELLHHKTTGWTYSASSFVPGSGTICDMDTDYDGDTDIRSNEYFAYKRSNLSTDITGSGSAGTLVRITQTTNNSIRYGTIQIGVLI